VIFRFSVKPTPSILREQHSVDLTTMKDTILRTEGRFDANFTPRVLAIAEALSAIVTVDHLMISGHAPHDSIIDHKDRSRYAISDHQRGGSG
jgi:chorismate synthase